MNIIGSIYLLTILNFKINNNNPPLVEFKKKKIVYFKQKTINLRITIHQAEIFVNLNKRLIKKEKQVVCLFKLILLYFLSFI